LRDFFCFKNTPSVTAEAMNLHIYTIAASFTF
jgi:hypothetical protein